MTERPGADDPLRIDPDGDVLRVAGALTIDAASDLWAAIERGLAGGGGLTLDLGGVTRLGSAAIAAIAEGSRLARDRGGHLRVVNLRPEHEALMAGAVMVPDEAEPGSDASALEAVGAWAMEVKRDVRAMLTVVADALFATVRSFFHRGRNGRLDAILLQGTRIGTDGLPIVTLISLLIGLIMGFQAAHQLRQFGANIFVADLVGLSMVRELGPLMTAIIIAGRSGSAMAAELGTMVVREEIDALRVMGVDPVRFLVVPRLIAITVALPALTLFADALGVFGGFLIGVFYLDLSPVAYVNQTLQRLVMGDVLIGLFKSLLFAWVIVFVSCTRGLTLTGGADAVGQATTRSVVGSIFLILVVDSTVTTFNTVFG